jgi:hypothetical protein
MILLGIRSGKDRQVRLAVNSPWRFVPECALLKRLNYLWLIGQGSPQWISSARFR